jgi:SAM-dependent methyltransferase
LSDTGEKLKSFWDSRYRSSDYIYGVRPNDTLVAHLYRIPPKGRVLCLADGEGRNSVFLAKQGFLVTAIDISSAGVAKAERLAANEGVRIDCRVADVTTFDVAPLAWDAIISIFLHLPQRLRQALHTRWLAGLSPSGVFIYEAYTKDQLNRTTGGPREPQVLAAPDEVKQDFPPDCIELFFAGEREIQEGTHHTGLGSVCQIIVSSPARQ